MLFVRNPTGVSHSPDEHAETADCLAGVEALADTLERLAGHVTAYWLERAWPATGPVRRRRRCVRRRGRRFTGVAGGAAGRSAERLAGLDDSRSARTATATRSTGRCAGAPSAERGTFWTWREQMYDVAGRLTRTRYFALARADVPGDGRGRDHQRRGVPLPAPPARRDAVRRPERDGARAAGGRPARPGCGSRCWTPATSPPGSAAAPEGVQRAVQRRRPRTAWAAAGLPRCASAAPAGDVVVGAAIHSVRAVPRDQMRHRGVAGPTSTSAPLHVHLSEQVAENDAVPRGVRRDAHRGARRRRRARDAHHAPCTPPT